MTPRAAAIRLRDWPCGYTCWTKRWRPLRDSGDWPEYSGRSSMMRSPSLTARPVDIGKPFLLPETRPAPRVLVLLSVGWFLVVLTVQPWIATVRTTTGVSAEESELGKGLLTAVVFLCAVAIAAPRFRIIVPPTYGL